MKPAPFEYFDPPDLTAAAALLARYGDDAKVLAGGQSLVPLLNMRLARPSVLIDINRVGGLSYIRAGDDGSLRIGALTRHRAVEQSELVRKRLPLLAEAVRQVGHLQIRSRGTIGGSLAHGDPAAELPGVITALDGELVLRGSQGERVVKARDFFRGALMTAIQPTELLVEVRLPALPPRTGGAFLEVARRQGDFALAGAAAVVAAGAGGTIGFVRLALIGVGNVPVRAARAEAALVGQGAGPATWAAAAAVARTEIEPESDIHGTADYRKHVAGVLVQRALATAWQRSTAAS